MAHIPGELDYIDEISEASPEPANRDETNRAKLRIPSFVRNPAFWAITFSFLAGILFFGGMQYLRLARLADRRLAEGPFSASVDILAAPFTIAVGDTLTQKDL